MTIYERIDMLRQEKGLSLNALEKQSGLSRQTIEKWQNRCNPSVDSVAKIAKYFGVSTDYLIGLTDNPKPHYE